MKWKKEVTIKKKDGYTLILPNISVDIPKEEEYLIKAVEKGIIEDEELVRIIMKERQESQVIAELTLSGILVKYQDYLAEDEGHYIIP